jgi:cellulose synthase/poly-beta-1,6-N-acetylglucosamine synthase-like glycosyltransferase
MRGRHGDAGAVSDARIAVIVPTLTGRIDDLRRSIARQTLAPAELEVVVGIRPSGRARNLGVARTTAPVIVFVDDDAVLGPDDLLDRLIAPLLGDPTVGVTGSAKLLPPDSSGFQRAVGRQVPRIEHPVVAVPLETTPSRAAPGYIEITTTCCATRRDVLAEVGGFDESLIRGVDTELFARIGRRGYRFIVVPHAWVYHPAPATLRALLHKHFMYGVGFAQEVERDPARGAGRRLRTPLHASAYVLIRTLALAPNVMLPYTRSAPSWRPGFKPLRALSSYAAALGYVYGWYRHTRRGAAKP